MSLALAGTTWLINYELSFGEMTSGTYLEFGETKGGTITENDVIASVEDYDGNTYYLTHLQFAFYSSGSKFIGCQAVTSNYGSVSWNLLGNSGEWSFEWRRRIRFLKDLTASDGANSLDDSTAMTRLQENAKRTYDRIANDWDLTMVADAIRAKAGYVSYQGPLEWPEDFMKGIRSIRAKLERNLEVSEELSYRYSNHVAAGTVIKTHTVPSTYYVPVGSTVTVSDGRLTAEVTAENEITVTTVSKITYMPSGTKTLTYTITYTAAIAATLDIPQAQS